MFFARLDIICKTILIVHTQSVPDEITTALTGKYTQGDAAFANYSVNIGAAFKF